MKNVTKHWTKVVISVLLFILCVSFPAELHAVSQKEVQKIEDAVPARATAIPKQPRKLLVFNLCEGYRHSSIPYWDKALEVMGRKTGAYEVVFSNDMSIFKPENLNQFDAVCFNNTTKLEFEEPLRQSLMNFIKGGKGIVGIHAATDNFYDWPQAAEMMGGQFCGHPWTADGTWAVKIDKPEHPLMAAFEGKGFKINDEIYRTKPPLYSRGKQCVLMSLDMTDEATRSAKGIEPTDVDIGISWVKSYGKGRLFYCSLGHNHHITWNTTILQHYLDGIQFAMGDLPVDTTASAQNQLEELLEIIATYEYGQSRVPLTQLTDIIDDVSDRPEELKRIEKRLLEFLWSDATLAGKQFICKQLSIIGTEEAVPTLAAMLPDAATSDMARYALERIPGSSVDEALRRALPKITGKERIGIINTLGLRGDYRSVPSMGTFVYNSDSETAIAAVAALGQIAGPQATDVLAQAKDKTGGKLRLLVLDAYLKCADELVARGEQAQALGIYEQLYASGESKPIRSAALRGMVTSTPEKAVGIVVDVLKGDDQTMQAVAIGLVREIPGTEITEAVAAELPNLSVAGQIQLLSALADRGDSAALPAVFTAAGAREESVRIAALKALASFGEASTVVLLAQRAAATKGAEREAARESLYRLRSSEEIDGTILGGVHRGEPAVRVELVRSIGRRNVEGGVRTLLKTARGADQNVRLESIRALRDIAAPKYLSVLVDLLIKAKSEIELKETERTVVSVLRRSVGVSGTTGIVLDAIDSVEDIKVRCSLLRVLGAIGDSKALGELREALEQDNTELRVAAIRTLGDWPNAEPAADLLKVASSADDEKHRTLALRGFVHLIGLDSDRSANETVELYRQAMGLASDVDEKKMVLSGLANVESFAALYMVSDYLKDSTLQEEAGAAMVKIAEATGDSHPQQTKILLRMVIQISKNESLRERAQEMIEQIK